MVFDISPIFIVIAIAELAIFITIVIHKKRMNMFNTKNNLFSEPNEDEDENGEPGQGPKEKDPD